MAFAAPLSILPVSGPAPTSSVGTGRSFVELDDRILLAQPGVVVVRAPIDVHAPILAHVARRLRTAGWFTLDISARRGAPLFGEVVTLLGLGTTPTDALACADAIAQVAAQRRVAVVAPLPAEGSWDYAVALELARGGRIQLVFVTAHEFDARHGDWDAASFEVAGELGPSDRLRWLSAVAEEAQTDLAARDLRALEAWWSKARRVEPGDDCAFTDLAPAAIAVLTTLALAGRSLFVASMTGASAAVEDLAAVGLVHRTGPVVSLSAACDVHLLEANATTAQRLATARILSSRSGVDPDPWAFARAAELFVTAGDFDAADACISSGIRKMTDAEACAELSARWHAAVAPIVGEGGLTLRIRAAERALSMGEAADAQQWCESAAALAPQNPVIAILRGRALMLLGDLVAARVSLNQAELAAESDEQRACVAAELAEVSFLAGDLSASAEHAKRAIELASSDVTRLAARSTLGKLLLTAGLWDEADEHFAEDALAASAGSFVAAELRARLNRGIALLSKGLLDEARSVFEKILEDGTRLGEDRACAYAYSNLGVVAYRQHDYGRALALWESAIRYPQALRGRMATALTIANLAELRLRLGLLDHAEHAISFGRRLLAGSAPPARTAHFKWVSAQIALARRNTDAARREVESAIADAQIARNREYLDIASNVAVRVALEDGDLMRAAHGIAQSEAVSVSPRAKAEVAILQTLLLRAQGQNAFDAAQNALARARAAGDEDILSEIYALLAVLHRDAGELEAAQAHCCRAIAVRDQVAAGLPADVRAAFLAKAEIVALSRLQASLVHASDVEEEAPRTQRVSTAPQAGPAREIVGDDPAIRSLLVAIRKVARSNSTVLIRGESGTGKELVAEALHRASERAAGPLVSVNCAALVETLLLSELFGHEKGAFTGASARRRGRFEMAEGGTLFLDEIGDISPRTQVALLRVLQERTFERVGGTTSIRANVRVICATHRDLRAMVERGEFREDLYYRLRGITLEVPALRSRIGDLPKIAEHLLTRVALERGETQKLLSSDAVDLLQRHRWPGNIRELENVLRAVALFADGGTITASDLIDHVDDIRSLAQSPNSQPPMSLRGMLSGSDDDDDSGELPLDEASATAVAFAQVRRGTVSLSDMKRQIERDCIARALAETNGNITRAAALLGMKRPRLSQLVKQYGLAASAILGTGPEENS